MYRDNSMEKSMGMTKIEELRARLAKATVQKVELSDEETAEAQLYAALSMQQQRYEEELRVKRELDRARAMDKAREVSEPNDVLELVDLGESGGIFVMRNAPGAAKKLQHKIKTAKDGASDSDIADYVIGCMVYPTHPKSSTDELNATRSIFDRFTFVPSTLMNVAMRLGGLRTDADLRKS